MDVLAELDKWEAKEREKKAQQDAIASVATAARRRRAEAWQGLSRVCEWASNPASVLFDPAPLRTIREWLVESGTWEYLLAIHEQIKNYDTLDSKAAFCIASAILEPAKGEELLLRGARIADSGTFIKGLAPALDNLRFDIENWESISRQEREARELQERKTAEEQRQAEQAKVAEHQEQAAVTEMFPAKPKTPAPAGVPISVCVEQLVVTILASGKKVTLDNESDARWLQVLCERQGSWVSGPELEQHDINLAGVRTDRIHGRLPPAVKRLVEQKRGKGARLKLA